MQAAAVIVASANEAAAGSPDVGKVVLAICIIAGTIWIASEFWKGSK